jgi:predicted nuclease of predicted toxin-antitoxin system
VSLLFDENLSRKLVSRLNDLFPGSTHVALVGLQERPDIDVWEYAAGMRLAIVTADADFYQIASTRGFPPKIIWIPGCDFPTAATEKLIRDQAIRIAHFLQDEEQAVLILRPARV